MTVNPREALLTARGRQTQAAINAAARTVIARKGSPAARHDLRALPIIAIDKETGPT